MGAGEIIDDATLLQGLVDCVPGYVCIVDRDLRFVWVNRVRSDLQPEQVIGHALTSFINEESAERARRCAAEVLRTGEPSSFLANNDVGGRSRWSEAHLAVIRGVPDRLILTSRDITEQRRAEDRLRENLNITRGLIEAYPSYMLLIEPSGRVAAASRLVARTLGLTVEDLVGTNIFEQLATALSPEIAESRRRRMAEVLDSVVPTQFVEELDGRAYDTVLYPIRTAGGEIGHLAIIAQDVTEQRRAEALLEERREHLWRAEKMEALGTLTAGIAHDFNNLLTPILTNAQMAIMPGTDDETRIQLIEGVIAAARQAAALVKQISSHGRSSDVAHAPCELGELVRETESFIRASSPTNVRIQVSIPKHPTWCLGDVSRLRQAMLNLCINAQHAMAPQGGLLLMELDVVPATNGASGSTTAEHARLRISDTGCGIPDEVLPRVFDPFFSTKDAQGGSGLGLFIVDGVIKEHGGGVTVESTPGEGTRFEVLLPTTPPPCASETRHPSPAADRPRLTVLVVDDEPRVRRAVRAALEMDGHRVRAFGSANEATRAFADQAHSYDAAVLDYQLTDGTGIDLSERLLALRPDLKVILFTGFVTEDVERALARRNVAIARKPNVVQEVLSWLADL